MKHSPFKPITPRCRCGWEGQTLYMKDEAAAREQAAEQQTFHARMCREAPFSTPYAMTDLIVAVAKDEMLNGWLRGDGTRSRNRG